MQEIYGIQVGSLGQRRGPLKEDMATHSSILAWRSRGQKSLVGYHPWVARSQTQLKQLNTNTHTHTHTHTHT